MKNMPRNRKLEKKLRESINTRVRKYFGRLEGVQTLEKQFPSHEIANFQILSRQFFEVEMTASTILGTRGPGSGLYGFTHSFSDLLLEARIDKDNEFEGIEQSHLQFVKAVPEDVDSRLGIASGLIFLEYEDEPMVVYCWTVTRIEKHCAIGIISRNVSKANDLINHFTAYLRANSIFRRKMLIPSVSYSSEIEQLTIVHHQSIGWDELILPDAMKTSFKDNIVEYIRHSDLISKHGFELKRGILFHGLPGTGKSLACSVIASQLKEFTTIVLAGDDQRHPRAAFDLARQLSPALIIFEDIDNIAAKREDNTLRNVLSELMNELDGLPERENIYVLFTTNNIQYLENALVERPGRVDLIFEFPLPTPPLREKLIRLYAHQAKLGVKDFDRILEMTEGTSPAFIKELLKRTFLKAIQQNDLDSSGIAILRDAHFIAAMAEFESVTNPSARRIVGFVS